MRQLLLKGNLCLLLVVFYSFGYTQPTSGWEGVYLGDIGLGRFHTVVVDTHTNELVLGARSIYFNQVDSVSTCSVVKWSPEKGVKILHPFGLDKMSVNRVRSVLFNKDTMIVAGIGGISKFVDDSLIFNYKSNAFFNEIKPFGNGYLVATPLSHVLQNIDSPMVSFWDGDTTFSDFENITHFISKGSDLSTVEMYQGNVYVGGRGNENDTSDFSLMTMWNGTEWVDSINWIVTSSGVGHSVEDFEKYKGDLYIGGRFYTDPPHNYQLLVKWNGKEYSNVGGGFDPFMGPGSQAIARLYSDDNYLYAVGSFNKVGGVNANNIARWDGNEWCACNYEGQSISGIVNYRDTLYIIGSFNNLAPDTSFALARYVGNAFTNCGTLTEVRFNTLDKQLLLETFPNPAVNNITLHLPTGMEGNLSLEIYDVNGKLMYARNNVSTVHASISVSVAHLVSGTYFVKLFNDKMYRAGRFIKQ